MWKIAFQVLPILFWLLSLSVVVRPLRLKRSASWLVAAVLALAFGKFAFFALVGGNGFNPDLPRCLIWAYCWAYEAAFFLTVFSAAAAVVRLAMRRFGREASPRAMRMCAAALLLAAACVAAWGMYESLRIPSVREIEIAWDALPASFDGYRVLHLSDLHCSSAARRERFEKIAERVNAIGADVVAITGDFVDGLVSDRAGDLEPIASIRAKDGVVCCTGNHEAYWDWSGWSAKFSSWRLRFPEKDGPLVVRRGDDAVVFGGMQDPAVLRRVFGLPCAFAKSAFDGIPDSAFRVLLFHRPLTEEVDSTGAGVRLQLSGHTHGGAMPILRQLVSLVNEDHVRGVYEFAPGRFLHVSPGTGQWAGFPLRIFTPVEMTLITLRRSGAKPAPQGR